MKVRRVFSRFFLCLFLFSHTYSITSDAIVPRTPVLSKQRECVDENDFKLGQQLLKIEKKISDDLSPVITALRLSHDSSRKGFAQAKNRDIKVQYKHILGIEFSFARQGRWYIHGFHHDYMNYLENTKIVEFRNKKTLSNGFYSAKLCCNGQCLKPTTAFFPANWSRSKVIKNILDAYDNFIKKGSDSATLNQDKYTIQGPTKSGQIIEMIITTEGKMLTAYPLLKG